MSRFKFGIVGCGSIAPHHAESVLNCQDTELTAVCDNIEERARDFAARFEVGSYYTDYKKMIDEADLDIICVCTPSGAHGEVAVYAANAKKHLLVEKPIEIAKAAMDQIIEAVNRNGVKMNSVFQLRTEPSYMAAKKAISEGAIGEVILADAYLKTYRSQAYYDSAGWRGTWAMDGGGALMNQGIHGVDLLQWFAGDVESIFARAATQARNIEVEDTAAAIVKFKNGAIGIIEGTTSVYPGQQKLFEIHGKDGTILVDDNTCELWKEGQEEGTQLVTDQDKADDTGRDPTKFSRSSHQVLIEDLIESIRQDRPTLIPPEEGRKAVDLILAIYESSDKGKEIKL